MITVLIRFALTNRLIVVAITTLVAALGIGAALRLPIDAVPDLTNVQVTVITQTGALSPIEVERYVTYPVEWAMAGLPRLQQVRSISQFGLSVVTVVFEEHTDLYWARSLVSQRIASVQPQIPAGYGAPEIGPLATALGEVLQFEVRGAGYSLTELRSLLDWEIIPQLRGVAGVTDVQAQGGFVKSYEVLLNPDRMASLDVSLEQVFAALENNNKIAGGGYVAKYGERRFIRGQALLKDIPSIAQVVIRNSPRPLLIRDVGDVTEAPLVRQGMATRDGRGEIVNGLVLMLYGENSRAVVESTKQRLRAIQEQLPDGVRIEILYDRASLIGRALQTVAQNLLEGGGLVVLILLIMLGDLRAGLIVALAIPLSMCFAACCMAQFGVAASLMSLGAIDFGLIVDSSVIMVENCVRRLGVKHPDQSREDVILDAAIEVRKPTMFGELIIAVVYLPILALEGAEGKLFRPMAQTVLFALLGSMLLSITLMPALASLLLRRSSDRHEVWIVRRIKELYLPVVDLAQRHARRTISLALALFFLGIPVAWNLGGEFMPRLDEGDILVETIRLPNATLEGADQMTTVLEKTLLTLPEVATVFSKTGRPEFTTDTMGVHQTDVFVILKPIDSWPRHRSRDEIISQMSELLRAKLAGIQFAFTQPIEMRVNELVAGVKSDVAVLLYGDDLKVLANTANEIAASLKRIPGAADVKAAGQGGLPILSVDVRQDSLARYGIDGSQVIDTITVLGGRRVGQIYEGRARYPLVVRFPAIYRENVDMLKRVPVCRSEERQIPLDELATIVEDTAPPNIDHDGGRRRTYVQCNVRGRDVASYVAEAQETIRRQIELPNGYYLRWGGAFEHLQSAMARLSWITPLALALILVLLQLSIRSLAMTCLVFLAIPFAATGGIFALAARGMPFSVSAGIGFIALCGIAALNGLVWVSAAQRERANGVAPSDAAFRTAESRLRPILMTALVASFGFIPMALSTAAGAEIQRPLATVVIGGLVTSTLLTTLALPAVYPWFCRWSTAGEAD